MNFLKLEPLTEELLPAVIELDRRCLGGLWSIEGYRREIESPNSDLLVLRGIAPLSGNCEAYKSADSHEAGFAPLPPKSGGLPSRRTILPIGEEEFTNFQNAVSETQSPPSLPGSGNEQMGDLGGSASSLTPNSQLSLIGLGCLWSIAEEAHITVLAIDPDYRQLGLGQAILYALLASAHDRGLEWATLEVRASNAAAIRLYEKFDFREVGRRKGYYSDGEDALILWRSGLQKPEFRLWLQECDREVRDRLRRSGYEISLETSLEQTLT